MSQKPELTAEFCGIKSPNPFYLAASPASKTADMIMRAFAAGWGGAVTKSLWPAQDLPDHSLSPRFAEMPYGEKRMMGLFNIDFRIDQSLAESFKDLSRVKRAYPRNALIISLKAKFKRTVWEELARRAEDTGADGIELCLSCPDGDPGGGSIGQNAAKSAEVVGWVKGATALPVLVKVTPNITDISPVARAAQAAGVDAISAINTAKCLAGVDLETLTPYPMVGGMSSYGGYSGPGMKPIALRFVAELASDPELRVPVSGIGGISTWSDAAEFLLLGASTVQVATAVMQRGYRIVEELIDGLRNFMERKGFTSVEQMIGLSLPKLTESGRLSRAYRVVSSVNRETCIGCGRCYISCRDGAYDAIEIGPDRLPVVNEEKCEGCALCSLVCPVDSCIQMVRREDRAGFFWAPACSVEN